jgi:sulfate adenylyltransferase subunit 1 (EFTu-like GTPase family)
VESGRIETGQAVVFLPSGIQARVRTIERFGESRAAAEAGECIGITLDAPDTLDRGQVACAIEDPPVPTNRFRATVFWMAPTPCSAGDRVVVRVTTQQVVCTLKRIENRTDSSSLEILEEDARQLQETEVASVVFEAYGPLVLYPFRRLPEMGRLVIDRDSEMAAGGLVSEPGAPAAGQEARLPAAGAK